MKSATYWIEHYKLASHPEGGYYSETYRSAGTIGKNALPPEFGGDRAFSTGIYFLLEQQDFSAFHRIQSDEMWHFYAGGPLFVYIIGRESGKLEVIKLGSNPEAGEVFQAVVPADSWFASRPAAGVPYSLVGCTVSPGFDFADFEMADRHDLLGSFPQHSELILTLTR